MRDNRNKQPRASIHEPGQILSPWQLSEPAGKLFAERKGTYPARGCSLGAAALLLLLDAESQSLVGSWTRCRSLLIINIPCPLAAAGCLYVEAPRPRSGLHICAAGWHSVSAGSGHSQRQPQQSVKHGQQGALRCTPAGRERLAAPWDLLQRAAAPLVARDCPAATPQPISSLRALEGGLPCLPGQAACEKTGVLFFVRCSRR